MGFRLVAVLLIASLCTAQTPAPAPLPAPSAAPSAPPQITVAPGTAVPLTLLNSIRSRTTKPGDAIRAVVAFPVTVGTQVAIPAGTYAQGTVTAIASRGSHGQPPNIKIHFTSLLFANGYLATLDAVNSDAMVILPAVDEPAYEIADARDGAPFLGKRFAAAVGQPTPPTLPPLPQVGPSKAVVIGTGVGVMAAGVGLFLWLAHHRAGTFDYVVFDNGWQFTMVLQHPLTLDAGQVAAAPQMPVQH